MSFRSARITARVLDDPLEPVKASLRAADARVAHCGTAVGNIGAHGCSLLAASAAYLRFLRCLHPFWDFRCPFATRIKRSLTFKYFP